MIIDDWRHFLYQYKIILIMELHCKIVTFNGQVAQKKILLFSRTASRTS